MLHVCLLSVSYLGCDGSNSTEFIIIISDYMLIDCYLDNREMLQQLQNQYKIIRISEEIVYLSYIVSRRYLDTKLKKTFFFYICIFSPERPLSID